MNALSETVRILHAQQLSCYNVFVVWPLHARSVRTRWSRCVQFVSAHLAMRTNRMHTVDCSPTQTRTQSLYFCDSSSLNNFNIKQQTRARTWLVANLHARPLHHSPSRSCLLRSAQYVTFVQHLYESRQHFVCALIERMNVCTLYGYGSHLILIIFRNNICSPIVRHSSRCLSARVVITFEFIVVIRRRYRLSLTLLSLCETVNVFVYAKIMEIESNSEKGNDVDK